MRTKMLVFMMIKLVLFVITVQLLLSHQAALVMIKIMVLIVIWVLSDSEYPTTNHWCPDLVPRNE